MTTAKQIRISVVEPHFIQVDYDIKTEQIRAKVRGKLLEHSFAMKSESVYYGLFTLALYNEIQQLKKVYFDDIHLNILTSAHPDAEAVMLKENYEHDFLENFAEAEQKLIWCDNALIADPTDKRAKNPDDTEVRPYLHIDKETKKIRAYTGAEILQRVRNAEYLIRKLQAGVAKRKENEINAVSAFVRKTPQDFEPLDARLRQMDSHTQKLVESCKKLKARQEPKPEKEDSGK